MLFPFSEAPRSAASDDPGSSYLTRKLDQHFELGPREQASLQRFLQARVQTVDTGVSIVEEGDAPREIHVILSGWACRTRRASNGRYQILAFHLPGDVCDFGAFAMRRSDSSIVAQTPLRVASIGQAALRDLSGSSPRLAQAFWRESAAAASVQREWLVRICQQNARQRVASLFSELAARLYVVGLADDAGFALPLTQADIGNACGLTPEHTNRTLRELRTGGLVAFERGRVEFLCWDALIELAGFRGDYLGFRTLAAEKPPAELDLVAHML